MGLDMRLPTRFAFFCFLLLVLTSCELDDTPAKPDYGPEVSVDEILRAMENLYRDSDPLQTNVGAFVHFRTTDVFAGGQFVFVAADTGHTLVQRVEEECTTTFHIVEKRYTHKQDGTSDLLVRELELPFQTSWDGPCDPESAPELLSSFSLKSAPVMKLASEAPVRVTFHRLKEWESRGPAPESVRARPKDNPNCLGIPNCELRFRHVSFDIVYWDTPEGSLVRLEYVVSPDIPQISGFNMAPLFYYIPGLFKSCSTQMMSLGDGETQTLVTECQEVVDFTYEASPTPTPTPTP